MGFAQTAYFVDGFHGGKWGHYPPQYTRYLVQQLRQHPDWKMNVEIEPATWDWVATVDQEGYAAFKAMVADPSTAERIEYVNPAYGQSYLYNISGESIIRQFAYGMEELHKHFPSMTFDTYSSEEPCFTSALPQILRGFGFKYASLKNPNTCWGGYVRAYGGEMLDWVGPDGTAIPTVPRYAMEKLKAGSTWETIGNANTNHFIRTAFQAGIAHPVGMCLQDAGWRNGPWLGKNKGEYHPVSYTTWRNYFEEVSTRRDLEKWRLSQEDIQVSLVWGAQVLQRIAQHVRQAENKILMAEKWAAMDQASLGIAFPRVALKDAWYPLLLAQHHDCWIVPYNKVDSLDWAGKVRQWTAHTIRVADSVMQTGASANQGEHAALVVRNVLPYAREDVVSYPVNQMDADTSLVVVDAKGNVLPTQWNRNRAQEGYQLLFLAQVPPMGEATYQLKKMESSISPLAKLTPDEQEWKVETDAYTLTLDVKQGGVIRSLRSKTEPSKEWVDTSQGKGFNELRGFFYDQNRFRSSTENPARIQVLENGPVRLRLAVHGKIAEHPFTQELSFTKGQARIDVQLSIDWQGQPHIGQFDDQHAKAESRKKAFYNDKYKLLALFPTNLAQQRIVKNAPFDVTESKLSNTFFSSWDSIKNNILLDWVEVNSDKEHIGLALMSDHTTTYAHGEGEPLALTVQYAGKGLWGRNYDVEGPTHMQYSLLLHANDWAKAQLWFAHDRLSNPLLVNHNRRIAVAKESSLLHFTKPGYQLSALYYSGEDLLLRIFNAAGDDKPLTVDLGFKPGQVTSEDLNGKPLANLPISDKAKGCQFSIQMPRFGIQTVRVKMKK
ncbi:glycoside hydrolase family 38 C-terminal domain-containing protein [Olivibacter ginsenosidimutans]|uniref:Glycoside hydrolase family 38 C-terminal domain-containing protein n=2 Tax=Olivibacter ginsenosidimutans TaxID=1176537 RepID=A0ABP9CGH1_9SPHI